MDPQRSVGPQWPYYLIIWPSHGHRPRVIFYTHTSDRRDFPFFPLLVDFIELCQLALLHFGRRNNRQVTQETDVGVV